MHDYLIRNAAIVDGTGSPAYRGDVAIEGDEVSVVGHTATDSREEIDGEGLTVSPGFIDIHTHSDYSMVLDGRAESAVYQGVTTQVNGNCGISPFPLGTNGPYLGPFDSARLRDAIRPTWESAGG